MKPQPSIIVLDACVLAGTYRRLVLLALISQGAFQPVVSDRILAEVRRAIPKTLSNSAMTDAEKRAYADDVLDGIEAVIPKFDCPEHPGDANLALPDPDDVHVAALALASRASVIVTENMRDFPRKVLEPLGIEAIRTDMFAATCLEDHPEMISGFGSRLRTLTKAEFGADRDSAAELKRVGLKRVAGILVGLGT